MAFLARGKSFYICLVNNNLASKLQLPKVGDGVAVILNGFFTSTMGCGSGLGLSKLSGILAASICKIPSRLMNQKRKLNPNKTIKAAHTVKASAIFKWSEVKQIRFG